MSISKSKSDIPMLKDSVVSSMSNRKVFEILRTCPRDRNETTSSTISNAETMLRRSGQNGLMDRWTKLLNFYKVPSQESGKILKSRGKDGVKLINTPEYRLLSDVSEVLRLDQVQCANLWRHFRDQRAKRHNAKELLSCNVLERITSFHFAERTFLIRSVQELLLKCHERSHPLNEISQKIVNELVGSKHNIVNTLIELLSRGFQSNPPWHGENDSSNEEVQFQLPSDVRKTGMVHLLSTVIRDPKALQSFWGTSHHIDFVKNASLGSTVYMQAQNGLKRGKILSINKNNRSYNIRWEGNSQGSEKLNANRSGLFALPPVSVDLSSSNSESRTGSIRVRVPRLNVWKLQCANVEGTVSGSVQDCSTRETQWLQSLRTRWSVLQVEEIEELLKLLCLLSFEPGMWSGVNIFDNMLCKLADLFVVRARLTLSPNLIRDLPRFEQERRRVGWYMMLCILQLILYVSSNKRKQGTIDKLEQLDVVFTTKCDEGLKSGHRNAHLFVPLMMAWGAFREDDRIERWIFSNPDLWNLLEQTLQYVGVSSSSYEDEIVYAEIVSKSKNYSNTTTSSSQIATLSDSDDTSYTVEESMTMMGMKTMELLDSLCRVFPVLRRLPQRFDGIFLALKASQTYPFDHQGLADISSRAVSSQDGGIFGMISHSIRQFPCHISPMVRIATSFVLNAESAYGVIVLLGSLDRFTWWCSGLEEGTMIGERLLVDAKIKLRSRFGGGSDDTDGCVVQTLSRSRCQAKRTDVLVRGDSKQFEKAMEFTLDTLYSAWPILMKLVNHTNHMLRYVISDNATTSHRGLSVNSKNLPHAVTYTTETVDILRLLVNVFANVRPEDIDILLRSLYPREHSVGGAMINLVSVLTHLLCRGTYIVSACTKILLSMRNDGKTKPLLSELVQVSYEMILRCISLLDVLLRSSQVGSEAVYNGVLSSGVASALSDMDIFKTLSRVRMYECQYGRYDVTVRYLRLLEHLLRHMRRSVLCLDISRALKELDSNGDGSISSQELKEGLIRMGLMISDDALRRLVTRFDRDGDGSIDYGELIRFIQKRTSSSSSSFSTKGSNSTTMRTSAQIARDRWQKAKTSFSVDAEEIDRLVEDELDNFLQQITKRSTMCAERHEELVRGTSEYVIDMVTKVGIWRYQDRVQRWQLTRRCMRVLHLLVLCQPLRHASVFSKTQEQSTMSTFGSLIESFAEHPGLRKSLVESTFILATSAFTSKPRTVRGQVSFGHERTMHLPVNFDEGMRNSSSSIERKELESMSAEGLKLILALLRLDDETTAHCNWPQSCRASLLLEPKCRWITALASYVNYNVVETEDNVRDLIPVLAVQILHATCDSLAVDLNQPTTSTVTTGTYSDAWLQNGAAHLLSSLEPETSAFRDSLRKHLSDISKSESSVALRVAILQFLSCTIRCHPALATHLLYPIHYEKFDNDEEEKKRDTNKEKKSTDDYRTLVLDDGVLEAALKPLLHFQDVIEHLEHRPQLVVAALVLCHDLWCSARPRPYSASTPFGRSHVRLVAAIREGRFAQAFWKGVCAPLNTWVGKFLDCTSSKDGERDEEELIRVHLYSGETLKPKIVNVTVHALRDHCYRLDARTWALRLVTLETFQNETRMTNKTSSSSSSSNHVSQFKGEVYFRESQADLRKKRRFYAWITEYTQVQYTPKVARTIEANSAEAGVELQLLQQQRFGFANPGLREYGPDYVFDTTPLRHQRVFCDELQRANSMWGLMEAQISLLEAWKASMLLTVSVQYAATTTRAASATTTTTTSKSTRPKIDSPMIRGVSKNRTSFFPRDRTSETMVYTIAKLIQKKPHCEGFVQQCAEKELWELLLSMLHHQLYDVKQKYADPRLAVTAQRNSTNIDAVDIVKRLQKSSLRIMKRGTGPNFAHLHQRSKQQQEQLQQQQQQQQEYFDPLTVKNPLLQGEINATERDDMDPSASQIEALCVGQLSTLITTLLVLWRKILGHNGELERVNDVVQVHRRALENDSKKRELSSSQRKRLYEAEIRIAEIDKIRIAFVNATAEMIGEAESRGGAFERWPGLFPLVSTLLATLVSSDGTQHLMSTRLSQSASRALLLCLRRATSEASRVDSDDLCARVSDMNYRALRRSLLGRTHLTRRMRSSIPLTSGLVAARGGGGGVINADNELSQEEEARFVRENMSLASLRRSCGRAESVLLTLTSLVQSTSFGCDSLILDPLPFLRACCADPLLQRLQQQREMAAMSLKEDSDDDISWGYDTTDKRRYPPHRVWCFAVRWIALLLTNVRHERVDGTEHSKNAAAIIRGCIDFVMSYSSMLLRALQPVDLTVASLEEATQVVALLRALSRHRQTWTFAMPAQRQTELLESARLLLRDLSIVIDPRSTDSPLQFRAVSPDERWKEENQRSKKRFQRAFKKLSGLSLMKRLKGKLGGSSKKSGGGMLSRLASAVKNKDQKEDGPPGLLRLPSTASTTSLSGGEDEDLTEETTTFRKSAKLLLLRAIRQLTSLMREVTPEESGAHPILAFRKANGSTHPPSLGHVAFCIQFCTTRREIMRAAKRDNEEEDEFNLLGSLAEEGTGLLVRNIALHLRRYSVTDKEKHAVSNLVKELLPEDCDTRSDLCLAWIAEARDWALQMLRPSRKKQKSGSTPVAKPRAGSALDIAIVK